MASRRPGSGIAGLQRVEEKRLRLRMSHKVRLGCVTKKERPRSGINPNAGEGVIRRFRGCNESIQVGDIKERLCAEVLGGDR